MTRKEFLFWFLKLVKKYKYRVYRKYPNVRSKHKEKFGRGLFAWCYIRDEDVSRGVMLTPILIVYFHRYYRRRKRHGKKAKMLAYFQERRAAEKLGMNEYNYTVVAAATEKDFRDLSPKQERLAIALRKEMLQVCVVMAKLPKEKKNHGKERKRKR